MAKARYELGEPLNSELEDLCEGYFGAPAVRLVREAVRAFIDERLANEPEVRKRHDLARKARLQKKDSKLAVINGGNGDEDR